MAWGLPACRPDGRSSGRGERCNSRSLAARPSPGRPGDPHLVYAPLGALLMQWLTDWLKQPARPRTPRGPVFPPHWLTILERLEGRVVPAVHVWTGAAGDGLWNTATNWTGGVPTTGETGGTIVEFDGNITSTDNIANL